MFYRCFLFGRRKDFPQSKGGPRGRLLHHFRWNNADHYRRSRPIAFPCSNEQLSDSLEKKVNGSIDPKMKGLSTVGRPTDLGLFQADKSQLACYPTSDHPLHPSPYPQLTWQSKVTWFLRGKKISGLGYYVRYFLCRVIDHVLRCIYRVTNLVSDNFPMRRDIDRGPAARDNILHGSCVWGSNVRLLIVNAVSFPDEFFAGRWERGRKNAFTLYIGDVISFFVFGSSENESQGIKVHSPKFFLNMPSHDLVKNLTPSQQVQWKFRPHSLYCKCPRNPVKKPTIHKSTRHVTKETGNLKREGQNKFVITANGS